MRAEVAFLGGPGLLVDVQGVVGRPAGAAMQKWRSRATIPSGRFESAVTGQSETQGGLVHWLQRRTAKLRLTAGNSPSSTYLTQVRNFPSGTSFSDLQATVQAWQPMHREWSMTKPSRMREEAYRIQETGDRRGRNYRSTSITQPATRQPAGASFHIPRAPPQP